MSEKSAPKLSTLTGVGYVFAVIAFIAFVAALMGDGSYVPKDQMIFWFAAALVSAVIPHVRNFKFSDMEIEFGEIKEQVKEVHASLDELKQAQREGRDQVYVNFATVLSRLSDDVRLGVQLELNRFHLRKLGVTPRRVVGMLKAAKCYDGESVAELIPEIIASIEHLQRLLGADPVDGIFGAITLSAWEAEYGGSSPN